MSDEIYKLIDNLKEENPETCINIIFVLYQYKMQQEDNCANALQIIMKKFEIDSNFIIKSIQ
jgi:hypothetical protein